LAQAKRTPNRIHFTPDRIRKAKCPQGRQQQFLWDDDPKSLGLRLTAAGAKSYVFEFRLHGRNGRITIGSTQAWDIAAARAEARKLQVLVDSGVDPRDQKAEQARQKERERHEQKRQEITLGELWPEYIEANKRHWGEHQLKDHQKVVQEPGLPRKRSKKKTKAGPLYELTKERLVDLSPDLLERWIQRESESRPTSASRAFRLLRAFLNWCEDQPRYQGLASPSDLLTKKVRKSVAPAKAKTDCLQKEMLADWFKAVSQHENPVVTAYLEALLLTGARREEMAQLRWADVDFRWRSLTLGDKVEEARVVPLPPYLAHKLYVLPRRNEWVFSSATSESGRLADVYRSHQRALSKAGLPSTSFHGLRRSFGTLSEWVECPVGVVAQIQGHKPSAIAEKHYRQRPLDLLRQWHTKIEGWILKEAGLEQPDPAEKLKGRLAIAS